MSKRSKKTTSGEGFSVGSAEGLGMSIGSLLKGGQEPASSPATAGEKQPPRPAAPSEPAAAALAGLAKAALQRRSAGCDGKIVTVVCLPQSARIDPEALAKEMRKALGCGSRVEEGRVVLQGDIAERAAEWLLKKGVKNIVK